MPRAPRPCCGTYRNGQPCRVLHARYTKCGQPYCGAHLPSSECSVCMELSLAKAGSTLLHCGHRFHTGCIGPWLRQHDTCPVCRAHVGSALLSKFQELDAADDEGGQEDALSFFLFDTASGPVSATLVLDMVGAPLDISPAQLESVILQILDRAVIHSPVVAATAAVSAGRRPTAAGE